MRILDSARKHGIQDQDIEYVYEFATESIVLMKQNDLGTIGGKPITQEMLDEFTADFERDWADSEIEVRPTSHGKALAALQALDIPVGEIEALERRARHERQPLSFFVRSILQNELAS